MSAKVALFSDIHGNTPALRAVLADIEREGCTQVLMLGDLINGVDPPGCVDLLRSWSATAGVELICIKGNAEAYLTTPDLDALPMQDQEWNRDMIELVQWYRNRLSRAQLDWIHAFPDTLRWGQAYLVHDSPLDRQLVQSQADPSVRPDQREWFYHGRGILPGMDEQRWQHVFDFMQAQGFSQLFCGHTHVPLIRESGDRLVCNLGSAGAPLDGDPRGSWALLETGVDGRQSVSIRRARYDIALIHALIEATPDYPDFKIPGYFEAYKQMFANGRHWRNYMPPETET